MLVSSGAMALEEPTIQKLNSVGRMYVYVHL